LPFVLRNVTIFLLFRPGSEKPSTMLLSPRRRSQVVRQRSAKPPSRVRISAAPLCESPRTNPSISAKTPSFTGRNASSSTAHSISSLRQDTTETDSIRPPTATQNATRPCQPHVTEDPSLAAVVDAWPELPEALKAGMVAMVKAASGSGEASRLATPTGSASLD
jgi:hypothetical protein